MVSSVLPHRWIPQISKWNSRYSPPPPRVAVASCRKSAASGGVSVSCSSSPPWLMMMAYDDGLINVLRFYCCAKNEIYNFFANEYNNRNRSSTKPKIIERVGSSQGWIAAYGENKSDLFLVDPTTDRHVKLPPLIELDETLQVHSLVLDDQQEKVFITFGSAHNLAFCYPTTSRHWTFLGGGDYESVVYSTIHRRLFCITSSSTFKLDAWDVGGETPRLDNDWAAQLQIPEQQQQQLQIKYAVCAEHNGELFVVVRHANLGDCDGGWVGGEYVGPPPTVDFDVYKIDQRLRRLMKMKESLEGLAIFVSGNSDPVAVKAGAVGVKPNSIYFGYAERVNDAYDFGIFDYQNGNLFGRWDSYSMQLYHQAFNPFWFTPRRHHNI